MDSAEVDARGTPEITSDDQPVVDSDAGAGTRAADDNTDDGTKATAADLDATGDAYLSEASDIYSDEEADLPFDSFDINDDGRIVKTASQCSRSSWKRPEVGWEVAVTVHRFCELVTIPADPSNDGDQEAEARDATIAVQAGTDKDNESLGTEPKTARVRHVEPDLQLTFKLGQDEYEGFPEEELDQAAAAGVELNALLHDGIRTMGRNERATFVVTIEKSHDNENSDVSDQGDAKSDTHRDDPANTEDESKPPSPASRRFEYDLTLDDWAEEVDLSERKDRSLVKRVLRDGDGATRPVDVGVVTVRCRVTRKRVPNSTAKTPSPSSEDQRSSVTEVEEGLEKHQEQLDNEHDATLVFDNLQSQDDTPTPPCPRGRAQKDNESGDSEGHVVGGDDHLKGATEQEHNDEEEKDEEHPSNEQGLRAPLEFVLDDCPFGSGVMAIVKSMSRGEQCEAWLDPMHGPVDKAEDGPFYHHIVLELVEVEALPPVWSADEVRQKFSTRFKMEGNKKFSEGDYFSALRRYEKAMRYADGVPPGGNGSENYSDEDDGEDYGDEQDDETFEPPESTQKSPDLAEEEENEDVVGATSADDEIASLHGNDGGGGGDETEVKEHKTDTFVDLQVAVLCNQAASFLKVGDGPAALEAAERASTLKAPAVGCVAGIKAAYRRACALEAVADWDAARDAFTELLALDPKNVQCSQGLARLARAEKAYQTRLRKAFGGFLESDKLKGFASDGRAEAAAAAAAEISGRGGYSPPMMGEESGAWSDDSFRESESDETGTGSETGDGMGTDSGTDTDSGGEEEKHPDLDAAAATVDGVDFHGRTSLEDEAEPGHDRVRDTDHGNDDAKQDEEGSAAKGDPSPSLITIEERNAASVTTAAESTSGAAGTAGIPVGIAAASGSAARPPAFEPAVEQIGLPSSESESPLLPATIESLVSKGSEGTGMTEVATNVKGHPLQQQQQQQQQGGAEGCKDGMKVMPPPPPLTPQSDC